MTTIISRLLQDEQGATAIEYGLLCALIAIACTRDRLIVRRLHHHHVDESF